jgi:uncharacterized protein YndB with AHSA1/START domain
MNSNLQFDFLVDKETNTLTVKREFAAKRPLVWAAYTQSDLLDQWFAPKPWKARTKIMDFREGGYWLYAMCSPEGEEHWGRMDYQKIQPVASFIALDSFCDAEGKLNDQLPLANWNASFEDLDEHTIVYTVVTYQSLSDLETIIQMGMKEGLTMTMESLDELLLTLKQ